MKILHLSDFHYKSSTKDVASQNLLIDALKNSLQSRVGKIDIFVFSGDLVFSGKKLEDFRNAHNTFLAEIGRYLNVSPQNLIITPGNHDVDRNAVSLPVKGFIRNITSSAELEDIVFKKEPNTFGLSCAPTRNYKEYERKVYKDGIEKGTDEIDDLVSTHYRTIDGKRLGFVSINTAWCCSSDDDKGNLFFPKSQLEVAIDKMKKANIDWTFLVLHHPIADLREFNKIEIEDLIYSEFHFLFSGHLHKREDFVRFTVNEGIYGSYAHAAFTKKEDGKIGYSVIDIDFETLDIVANKYVYDFDERYFLELEPIKFQFPCNQTKQDQVKLLKTLRKKLSESIEKANELLVSNSDHNHGRDFTDLFVNPVLKDRPDLDISNKIATSRKIKVEELCEDRNFLIYGRDKTGKTAILFKLLIDLLKQYTQRSTIPLYINLEEYKNGNAKKLNIENLVRNHLETNNQNSIKLLQGNSFKILLDNFDPFNKEVIYHLSTFFSTYEKAHYVIVTDQTLLRSYEFFDLGLKDYDRLFIHDISRVEIRQLTQKWPNIPTEKREAFIDSIIELLKQHSMPFNFWTLSIFLWIFSTKNNLNFNNNSELIELYVDDLLDRSGLANNPQNRFSYQNYKTLLANLAHYLLTNKLSTNYSLSYTELIQFADEFRKRNIKRVGNTSEIVTYLLEKGVLKKIDDDFITFRLNGVFEYFIAFYFTENEEFLKDMLDDDKLYLSFRNEYELYSGFQRSERSNKVFLESIYNKTKVAFNDLNHEMEGSLDAILERKTRDKQTLDYSKPIEIISQDPELGPLTEEERDDVLEPFTSSNAAEVKPKKLFDVSVKNFEILERYLVINSRVFRNIENIGDQNFIEEVFDFLIFAACNLGFLLIEEMEDDNNEELNRFEINSKKSLVQFITSQLPMVVQSFVSSSLGHLNLETMILSKISELNKDESNNQYRLFILHSLLLDLDLQTHKKSIDTLIQVAKLGIIKSAILLKLLMLLLMKSYDDDSMILYLREKIKEVNLIINPQTNIAAFDSSFEKTKKILLAKRHMNRIS